MEEDLTRIHDTAEDALDSLHDGDLTATVELLEHIKRLSS